VDVSFDVDAVEFEAVPVTIDEVIVEVAFPSPVDDCEYEQLVELDGNVELVEFEEIAVEFVAMVEIELPVTDRDVLVVLRLVLESDVEVELEMSVVLVELDRPVSEEVVESPDEVPAFSVEFTLDIEIEVELTGELVIMEVVVCEVVEQVVVEFVDEFVDGLVGSTELVLLVATIGRDVIGTSVEVEELLPAEFSEMMPTAAMATMITTTTTTATVDTALFFGFKGS
jgi:hypothetical protein